jgi:hypothetical protein
VYATAGPRLAAAPALPPAPGGVPDDPGTGRALSRGCGIARDID